MVQRPHLVYHPIYVGQPLARYAPTPKHIRLKQLYHTKASTNYINKSPSRTCSTRIPQSVITGPSPGLSPAEPRPPSTASSDSSAALCSMESSKPISYTTTSRTFHSTTRTKQPRPSSWSWAAITSRTPTNDGPVGFLKSLWTSARWCQWVEASHGAEGLGKDIVFYRNRNNLGVAPLRMEKTQE